MEINTVFHVYMFMYTYCTTIYCVQADALPKRKSTPQIGPYPGVTTMVKTLGKEQTA
jgi:hypothetical protein